MQMWKVQTKEVCVLRKRLDLLPEHSMNKQAELTTCLCCSKCKQDQHYAAMMHCMLPHVHDAQATEQ